jgi:hypothetical protein
MNLVTLPDHLLRPDLKRRLPSTARAKDWTGYNSEHFEVLGFAGFVNGFATYLCRCECGEAFLCVGIHIPRRIKCGVCRRTRHKPERAAWKAMHQRWGKMVVNAWSSFDAFYASMGARPSPKHVVVRIDTQKKFGPNNCRWSTQSEPRQWLSARFRQIRLRGQTKLLSEWARELGITRQALWFRVQRAEKRGIGIKDVLTTPRGTRVKAWKTHRRRKQSS